MMFGVAQKKVLDLSKRNPILDPLLKKMKERLVGQECAAEVLVDMVSTHLAGFSAPGRPAGNALLLGPTGSGKTHAVEILCEGLVGDQRGIGSPAGYLGHRETPPLLTQKRIDGLQKEGMPLSVILIDEIEKASDTLWQLLLGVLDKAMLTLGTNDVVNFEKCLIIMTSNLGAKEMQAKKFGFKSVEEPTAIDDTKLDTIAKEAAKRHFTPEFINRLDHIVTFKTLTKTQVAEIMQIELGLIQDMFYKKAKFVYQLSPAAKYTLLENGYSVEYGARNLKREIERRVRLPLSGLVSSGQIAPGSAVVIDQVNPKDEQFEFSIQKLSETQIRFTDLEESIL